MLIGERQKKTGVEVVQIVRKDGIAGLWEFLKDQFADLKETVMDAIMSIIETQVIQAGIKWILGLLSPVGAFVKAVMAIIEVVKFFIQRAAQIAELVKAFIDSITAIASGKVGAVAKSIENALGKAIPVLIGLLAAVLGISGLADKVLGVIRKIRKRITDGIVKFWNFVKAKGAKLLSKVGVGKKDKKEKKADDKRTTAQKEKDLNSGIKEGTKLLKDESLDKKEIQKRLDVLENTYNLEELKIVTDKTEKDIETVHIHGKVNPEKDGEKLKRKKKKDGDGKLKLYTVQPLFTLYANNPAEFRKQIKRQEEGINTMKVGKWITNREDFVKNGRKAGDLDKLREEIRKDIAKAYREKNRAELRNLDTEVVIKKSEEYAKTILTRNHAILHNPDQVAGGDAFLGDLYKKGEITDETSLKASSLIGHLGTNSSIGSQWSKERAKNLYDDVIKQTKDMKAEEKTILL